MTALPTRGSFSLYAIPGEHSKPAREDALHKKQSAKVDDDENEEEESQAYPAAGKRAT